MANQKYQTSNELSAGATKRNSAHMLPVSDWLSDLPENTQLTDLIEVQFKNTRKGYFHNTAHLPLEKGVKADRIAAIAGSLHVHPEYLRELFTHEQLECILSMAGFRDKRYRLISTDSVEVAIAIGLMESHVSCKRSGWTAELSFASDAKDILARADGADLEDYYSALHEKDQNVIAILYAYGMIEFEELRKWRRSLPA